MVTSKFCFRTALKTDAVQVVGRFQPATMRGAVDCFKPHELPS